MQTLHLDGAELAAAKADGSEEKLKILLQERREAVAAELAAL